MNRSLALLICTAAIAVPRVAAAKPHVALLPITDDAGGEVLDAITAAVEDDLALTSAREIGHTIDKLGLGDELADRDLAKLVTQLDVDALVRATLEHDATARILHVRVYAFGKRSHGFTVRFGHATSAKFKHAMHDALLDKIAQVTGDEKSRAHGKPGDKDGKHHERDADLKGGTAGNRSDRGDDDGDDDGAGSGSGSDDAGGSGSDAGDDDGGAHRHHRKHPRTPTPGDDDDKPPAPVGVHSANHDAARADLGISILTRSFTFNSTNIPQAPKPYSQSAVPAARFAGELYPFAFSNPTGAAAGFGFAVDYDQTLSLNLRTPAQPDTPLAATQRHWSVGVRYRISFGKQPTSPTLTLGVSYGGREFVVDRAPLMGGQIDLPDVDYMIIEPGLAFRLPIGRSVALTAGARGLLVRSAGAISDMDQYGSGSVDGIEGELGIELMFGDHYALRIAGELTQVAFSFDGTGVMSNDRDSDPTTIDVVGATDRYIGAAATFAFLY